MKTVFLCLLTWAFVLPVMAQSTSEALPDLTKLQGSGYVMGPGSATVPISGTWQGPVAFMKPVNVLDDTAARIEASVCGTEQNKSVLVVGEPSQAFAYLLARMAGPRPGSPCANTMWHVEVNVNKIEAGHKYVGEVEEYWSSEILAPSDRKDVVLYLPQLDALVGLGSHSNDQDGIEREYVSNIRAGRIRTVAFIDKFSYNEMSRSRAAYVLEAFADKVILPPISEAQTQAIATSYLKVLFPAFTLNPVDLAYITRNITFYQPNRQEPDRTMSVLTTLVRNAKDKGGSVPIDYAADVQSVHPYLGKTNTEWTVTQAGASELALVFDRFETEATYDVLKVFDADSGTLLGTFSGTLAAGTTTQYFPSGKLKLVFTTDDGAGSWGFAISKIRGRKTTKYTFSREDARRAVMSVAQVPQWLMDRDYKVIRELPAKLEGDVVGVTEGKKDLIRLAKSGYVAGRTDDKPIATILFTGPTGTGKSYIAKKMADFMQMKLITLDMTSYKDPSSFAIFQEVMARNLTNTPYAMYLFEEIDKASIEVLDQLYFMMDEGVFYDRYQRPLFARGAFLMLTTNAGSDVILKNPNNPLLRSLVMDELKKSFRASFLNRFDAISIFKAFTDAEFLRLAQTMIDKKVFNIKGVFNWTVTVDSQITTYIATFGKSAEFGARPMERLVEGSLGIGIAEYQLANGAIPDEAKIEFKKIAGVHDFRITVGSKSVDYVVDPQDNHGISMRGLSESGAKFFNFLKSVRMYSIHD